METERRKAVVKLDTCSVEIARILKPRLIRHLSLEHMDKRCGGFILAWEVLFD